MSHLYSLSKRSEIMCKLWFFGFGFDLDLIHSTITRWVEDIRKDIRDQLFADLRAATCFSIAVDESSDVTDFAQVAVVANLECC